MKKVKRTAGNIIKYIPTCIINQNFGILCPSCGGTRCVTNLILGNIKESFLYHPVFFVTIILLFSLSGCVSSDSELPSGRASEVRINNGNSYWDLGSGNFQYISDTTIKFVRDSDGKVYYLSTSTIIDIIVE